MVQNCSTYSCPVVENNHCVKRWMRTETNNDMSPFFVDNMKCVIVDIGVLPADIKSIIAETMCLQYGMPELD